jgi:hypothetical protein
MDFNKLTTADRVVGISAAVFLIAVLFLPWYGFGDLGSDSGAAYFLTGWIPLLLAAAMVTVIVLDRFTTVQLPKLPIPWGQAFLIAGVTALVLVVLRTIIPSTINIPFSDDVTLDRKFGLFVALLAAIGLAVGGFLKSKEPEPVTSGGAVQGGYPGTQPPPPPPGGTSF